MCHYFDVSYVALCFLPIGTSFGVFQIGTDLSFAELGLVFGLPYFQVLVLQKVKFQVGPSFGLCRDRNFKQEQVLGFAESERNS